MGVCFIIGGSISALCGVFAFIIGAIPGIITILMGVQLCNASNEAATLSNSIGETELNNQILSNMIEKYTSFFRIFGIYIIVGIALTLITIIVAIVFFAFVFNKYTNELSNLSIIINLIK